MTDISDVQVAVGLDGRHIDGRMTSGEASPRTRINALRSRFRSRQGRCRFGAVPSGSPFCSSGLGWCLYLDIRYTFGALRTAGEQLGQPPTSSCSPTEWPTGWPDVVARPTLTFGPTVLRERLTLSIAILFAGLAGAGLARSLRRWTSAMGADQCSDLPPAHGAGMGT